MSKKTIIHNAIVCAAVFLVSAVGLLASAGIFK